MAKNADHLNKLRMHNRRMSGCDLRIRSPLLYRMPGTR